MPDTRGPAVHRMLLAILLVGTSVLLADQAQEDPRIRSGLKERVTRRLAQFDVTVTGPLEIIADLGVEDFDLAVGGQVIDDFFLDSACDPAPPGVTDEEVTPPASPPEQRRIRPRSYVFYFDQKLMTFTGRNYSIELARGLIDGLVAGTDRGMIVSSARSLEYYSDWTTDPAELHEALDRLDGDRQHWDSYGAEETNRVEEILDYVARGECPTAQFLARRNEREEMVTAKLAMERLSGVLGGLDEAEPPKILVYFSDMMRKNAGEHYFKILGPCMIRRRFTRSEFAMARLLEEAAVAQVRVYPVQARGLGDRELRFEDTKSTLVSMGLETGGRAFLGGTSVPNMLERLHQDLSCLYLVSFDPERLPTDENLTVSLRSKRDGVRVRARGLIAVQSPERRQVARLVRAFSLGRIGGSGDVWMESMPMGYSDGKFQVLVQAVVPAPGVVEGTWDFGFSLVRKDKVKDERSGRLERVGPDSPLVIESVLNLKRGESEVVGVLHEPETERTLSAGIEMTLELPSPEAPRILDLKLFAESPGVYWRDGRVMPTGSLMVGDGGVVHLGSRITIKCLVCRDPETPGVFLARRTLRGLEVSRFEKTLEVNLERESCMVLQDVLPANWLSEGEFTFDLGIHDGDRTVAQRSATFSVER